MKEQNPPQKGQKVFLPELNLYGEIVEIYSAGGALVSSVRVLINGKPTLIETTFLIVQAAEQVGALVRAAAVVWGKIKQPLQSLCRALRICKSGSPKLETPAVAAELSRLARGSAKDTQKYNELLSKTLS